MDVDDDDGIGGGGGIDTVGSVDRGQSDAVVMEVRYYFCTYPSYSVYLVLTHIVPLKIPNQSG